MQHGPTVHRSPLPPVVPACAAARMAGCARPHLPQLALPGRPAGGGSPDAACASCWHPQGLCAVRTGQPQRCLLREPGLPAALAGQPEADLHSRTRSLGSSQGSPGAESCTGASEQRPLAGVRSAACLRWPGPLGGVSLRHALRQRPRLVHRLAQPRACVCLPQGGSPASGGPHTACGAHLERSSPLHGQRPAEGARVLQGQLLGSLLVVLGAQQAQRGVREHQAVRNGQLEGTLCHGAPPACRLEDHAAHSSTFGCLRGAGQTRASWEVHTGVTGARAAPATACASCAAGASWRHTTAGVSSNGPAHGQGGHGSPKAGLWGAAPGSGPRPCAPERQWCSRAHAEPEAASAQHRHHLLAAEELLCGASGRHCHCPRGALCQARGLAGAGQVEAEGACLPRSAHVRQQLAAAEGQGRQAQGGCTRSCRLAPHVRHSGSECLLHARHGSTRQRPVHSWHSRVMAHSRDSWLACRLARIGTRRHEDWVSKTAGWFSWLAGSHGHKMTRRLPAACWAGHGSPGRPGRRAPLQA